MSLTSCRLLYPAIYPGILYHKANSSSRGNDTEYIVGVSKNSLVSFSEKIISNFVLSFSDKMIATISNLQKIISVLYCTIFVKNATTISYLTKIISL